MVTQVPFDELPSFRRTFGAAVSEERSTLEAFLDLLTFPRFRGHLP